MEGKATNTERVWMTYEQAAEYTGLDRTTLWRAVRRGTLRAGGARRAVRFYRDDLDTWLRGEEAK